MNLKLLFSRTVPAVLTIDELTNDLVAARALLAARDQQIAELEAQVQRQREACATETARKNDAIAELQAQLREGPRDKAGDSHRVQALKQDLAAAFELLDEFDADACRGHEALARVAELEAELEVVNFIVTDPQADRVSGRDRMLSAA